jgi:epoxyqueuosine reductase QueG
MEKGNEKIIEEIRKIAEDENIPVLGVSHASKMANESPGYRPEDLLQGAQSLICFGIPIPQGAYRALTYTAEMIWRSQNLYYRRLDTLSIRFAALLEESGVRAVPIYGCFPMGMNNEGDVAGYLNLIRMGEGTGIGVIGKNGLLIHSRYGARLMLGGVVTTALLPDLRYPDTAEPGCPPDCRICADVCPVKAISIDEKRVNIIRCLGYTSRTPFMPKLLFLILRALQPASAARLMNLRAFDEHTFHVCSQCVALCPFGAAMHH